MDDLISRKAAIEALKPCAGVGNRALDKLRALPSVETRIIRCKDCKHWTDKNAELCDIWDHYIGNGEFFCGCGERREADAAH